MAVPEIKREPMDPTDYEETALNEINKPSAKVRLCFVCA